jgi:hypothetical protein
MGLVQESSYLMAPAAVWMQLGQATHPTKLCIGFDKALSVGAFLKDLAPLSYLNGLQCLTYRLGKMAAHVQDPDASDAQFLSNLTALKTLNGDIVVKAGMLEHISSCTALKSLHLHTTERVVSPSSSDWQALGQLVHLTKLYMSANMMLLDTDMQLGYSALQRLTGLQQVTWRFTAAAVPTLTALTKLTSVNGSWVARGQEWDGGVKCEQVVHVGDAGGVVPFKAFPNVEVVNLARPLDTASWEALGRWCPKVKQVRLQALPRPRGALHGRASLQVLLAQSVWLHSRAEPS